MNDEFNSSHCNGCGTRFLARRRCFHWHDLDHAATQSAHSEWKLREARVLYKEFITEASRLAVDALAHSLERPDQIMALYGILSRIRLMSGEEVVRQGEACCRRIIELYGRPNLIAPIVGPTLGGWLCVNYNWRWIFLINVPIGLVAAGRRVRRGR